MELSPDQMTAIAHLVQVYGRGWKRVLRQQWERASAVPALQALGGRERASAGGGAASRVGGRRHRG